ncbi:unnamed protein product [Phaedon cochleariae]|uniref:Mpv17-like protein 2 n=1 Tax=Phaedon cochleariae TaxID=80249 RepID=A0A9P0DQT2_PHACE|nr:unnamed protein product [Phaedon cochleariae]
MFKFRSCISRVVAIVSKRSTITCNSCSRLSTSSSSTTPIRPGITLVFGKYLLATNTISSGVLMLIGDICQQEVEYRQRKIEERYDYGRLSRMFIVGVALGPLHHYYYVWLAKTWPARSAKIITWKILLDQIVMSPICIAGFFYGMGILERKSVQECSEELVDKFKEVYLLDWIVWPPTQFINFYYIAVKYQVLYINAVTMLYDVFLSYIKHRELAREQITHVELLEAKKI